MDRALQDQLSRAGLADGSGERTRTMETSSMTTRARWDAPFWAFLLMGLLSLGSLGCFGFAAAAQASASPQAEILTTDNCPPPADL